MESAEINDIIYLETGWVIMEDHFRHRGPSPLSILVGEQKQKEQKNVPILLLRQSRKAHDA